MDDEPKYDVFDFDTCTMDFIAEIASTYGSSAMSLDLKPLPDSLKFAFLGPNESLRMIIAFNLDQDYEGKLLNLLK